MAMQEFRCAKGDNPNYMVHIQCLGQQVEIIADMPEQVSIGVSSEWESRLPYYLADLFSRVPLSEKVINVLNINPGLQSLSYQMWMGTTPIEIPLTLIFDAETSALEQVFKPMTYLMAIAQPVLYGDLLLPPGPRFGGTEGDMSVAVRIGRIILLADCILVSAQESFDTRLDAEGYPISGTIELTLRTGKVYGYQDWMKAAKLGGFT